MLARTLKGSEFYLFADYCRVCDHETRTWFHASAIDADLEERTQGKGAEGGGDE